MIASGELPPLRGGKRAPRKTQATAEEGCEVKAKGRAAGKNKRQTEPAHDGSATESVPPSAIAGLSTIAPGTAAHPYCLDEDPPTPPSGVQRLDTSTPAPPAPATTTPSTRISRTPTIRGLQ